MTKNEYKLFDILRKSEEPELSVLTAIKVFSAFVEQLEADQVLQPDDLLVSS
jgi:hypothetical protein